MATQPNPHYTRPHHQKARRAAGGLDRSRPRLESSNAGADVRFAGVVQRPIRRRDGRKPTARIVHTAS
jgi:hypothetical protein